MQTEIFQSYTDFLARPNKEVNGVSPEFAERNPNYAKENESNLGCYGCAGCTGCTGCIRCIRCTGCAGCYGCTDCTGCIRCTGITEGYKYACFIGIYKYICSPRIDKDGKQFIQLGCHLRSREDWAEDFWNNEREFPNDGSKKSNDRLLAFKIACMWLDANK